MERNNDRNVVAKCKAIQSAISEGKKFQFFFSRLVLVWCGITSPVFFLLHSLLVKIEFLFAPFFSLHNSLFFLKKSFAAFLCKFLFLFLLFQWKTCEISWEKTFFFTFRWEYCGKLHDSSWIRLVTCKKWLCCLRFKICSLQGCVVHWIKTDMSLTFEYLQFFIRWTSFFFLNLMIALLDLLVDDSNWASFKRHIKWGKNYGK